MNALGVDINYTQSNNDVYYAFQQKGDFVWPNFLEDLEDILSRPVRVALIYGDADYICNWFGGEAVSLATKYEHSAQFKKAGYAPFVVDGVEYGETREFGNFSFTRVYEAGHEVPYYQPIASLQLFNRTLFGWELPDGKKKLTDGFASEGKAKATHTESSVALPSATKAALT
jgi:carboxypeptidase D